MTASEAFCDFCDLPLAQCVHGQPPPPPKPAATSVKAAPKPRSRSTTASTRTAGTPAKQVNRRWTAPETLKPLILAVLTEAGGQLDVEDFFLELEIAAEDKLMPGDRETTPGGELRWHYAARRARLVLIEEGLMTKGTPGVWQLAR